MKKATSLIARIAFGGLAGILMTAPVLAESLDSSYYTTYDDAAASSALAAMSGVTGIFSLCMFLISCAALVYTIIMIVDVAKRNETEVPNRTMWLLLMIFLGFIPAIIYHFSVKKKLDQGKTTVAHTATEPPAKS